MELIKLDEERKSCLRIFKFAEPQGLKAVKLASPSPSSSSSTLQKQRPSPPVSWRRSSQQHARDSVDGREKRRGAQGLSAQGKMASDSSGGGRSASALLLEGDYAAADTSKIEAWLDEHPEFFQEYLIRKGTRSMVDSWLLAHALPPGITTTLHDVREEFSEEDLDDPAMPRSSGVPCSAGVDIQSTTRTFSSGSKGSSGSGTPVRKISAHEFEKGGLIKPLVSMVDGTHTFLSPPVTSEVTGQIRKRSRHDVQGLNETDLIFELVKDICDDLDVRSLCHKILQNVGILTVADR